jgi:hypothetical protein
MAPQYIGAVGLRIQDTYRVMKMPAPDNLFIVGGFEKIAKLRGKKWIKNQNLIFKSVYIVIT